MTLKKLTLSLNESLIKIAKNKKGFVISKFLEDKLLEEFKDEIKICECGCNYILT